MRYSNKIDSTNNHNPNIEFGLKSKQVQISWQLE